MKKQQTKTGTQKQYSPQDYSNDTDTMENFRTTLSSFGFILQSPEQVRQERMNKVSAQLIPKKKGEQS